MTTFLLIRHGQTDAIGHYLAGTAAGTRLNATGHAQVQRLAERLRGVPLTAVVSSPLTRARETAAPIAASHGLEPRIAPAFTEFEVGEWTGRTFRELEADPEWRRFNAVRSLVRPPGGELMLEVQHRAVSALLDLGEQYPDETIAVVSHGDVIRAVLMFFLAMPIDLLHRIDVSPARVSVVTLDRHTPAVRQVNGDCAPEAA